ncbi:MAG: 50S ribosomal protein L17 [bacterium]|nr:50S ribosomal protein L17 [bacterium]
MRHNVYGTKLSRDTNQRQALLKGLAGALIRSESIETTEAKAKAARDLIEKLITQAKRANLSDMRQIEAVMVDKELVDKLVHNIAPRFNNKNGGYLRLVKTGFRVGDNAPLVRMELTVGPQTAAETKPKPKAQAKPKVAAKPEKVASVKKSSKK